LKVYWFTVVYFKIWKLPLPYANLKIISELNNVILLLYGGVDSRTKCNREEERGEKFER